MPEFCLTAVPSQKVHLKMRYEEPIKTVSLIPALDGLLIEILNTLTPEDWKRQTLARGWTIKDVAAHLLDGNLRSLSSSRDDHFEEGLPFMNSNADVIAYLNRINNEFVSVMKKISPQLLIELLVLTNTLFADHLQQLDPFAKSLYPVGWAGESESQNWFDIARQYTEKWHHQQQIRTAVGEEKKLFAPMLFLPYLQTSMMALPFHLKDLHANDGEAISITIEGDQPHTWRLIRLNQQWLFTKKEDHKSLCQINMHQDLAWRMFSKEIPKAELLHKVVIAGDHSIADKLLEVVAVMA